MNSENKKGNLTMANNNNEKRVIINLYMEVPVSEELWWQLREEENDNAIHKIADKCGFVLMDDEEAETVPEWTPVIYAMDGIDSEEVFYLA